MKSTGLRGFLDALRKIPILKRAGAAFLTPIRFTLETGHLRSAIQGRAVDSKGGPIPWYTYPAIDFLSQADFSQYSILEWGGGHSTLWWAERAASVLTLETNASWFEYIRRRTLRRTNVELHLCETAEEYITMPLGRSFDWVIIDGDERLACARTALRVIRPHGGILLDDSMRYWGNKEPATHIADMLQRSGFWRVDFYGYAPCDWCPKCTSVFFGKESELFRRLPAPFRRRGFVEMICGGTVQPSASGGPSRTRGRDSHDGIAR